MPDNRWQPIERTRPTDLMALAEESAAAPTQVAAVILQERPVPVTAVRDALADHVPPFLGVASDCRPCRFFCVSMLHRLMRVAYCTHDACSPIIWAIAVVRRPARLGPSPLLRYSAGVQSEE